MGSILAPALANAFCCLDERKWLEKYPLEFKAVFYKIYVDCIFYLFKSTNHLEKFRNQFNICHRNMSFLFEKEKKKVKCPT